MPNPFYEMAGRMDAATIRTMGKTAVINDVPVDVVPAELLMEMGALSGSGISLVVFTAGYWARRNDAVEYDGEMYSVTRHELFNGKPRIFIE